MSSRVRPGLAPQQRLRLSQGLSASIRVLQMDASGLTRYLEEQAAENPHLTVTPVPPAPGDWLPRWQGSLGGGVDPALLAQPAPGLLAHVTAQILRRIPPGRPRRIAEALAGALAPTGWLDRPLAEIAAETGAPLAEVEAVLEQLQRIDPPGLFARSLAECLRLQADEAGWLDPVAEAVLAHLPLVAAWDIGRLARLAGSDAARVTAVLHRIRRLNPKPGAAFDAGGGPPAREPDLILREGPGGWTVELNRSALPALAVTPPPRGQADDLARARVAQARALSRQVAARGETLLRVAQEMLRRQPGLLAQGTLAQVPMTMAEIAEALDLHPTTVGRAVAGASLDTPRGPVWLRRLFSGALGDGRSAAAVRAAVAALVASEPPSRPISDAAIAAALAAAGLGAPARRTVAKYRAMLGLPPAHLRRRVPGHTRDREPGA